MSALPNPLPRVPRKPIQKQSREKRFDFEFWHKCCHHLIPTLSKGQGAMAMLLWNLLSRANQKALDGSFNGPTAPIQTAKLAEELQCQQSRINQLRRQGARDGLFDCWTIKEAVEKGLMDKPKRMPAAVAYVFVCKIADWEQIARQWSQEAPDEDDPREDEQRLAGSVKVASVPLVTRQGKPAKEKLSKEARRALRSCQEVEAVNETGTPIAQDVHIEAGILKLTLRDVPTVAELKQEDRRSEGETRECIIGSPLQTKHLSDMRTKGESQQTTHSKQDQRIPKSTAPKKPTQPVDSIPNRPEIAEFLNPLFAQHLSSVPDQTLLEKITAALGDCPIHPNENGSPSYAHRIQAGLGKLSKQRKEIDSLHFLWWGKEAGEAYRTWAKHQPKPQAAKPYSRVEMIQDLRNMLALTPNHFQADEFRKELEELEELERQNG